MQERLGEVRERILAAAEELAGYRGSQSAASLESASHLTGIEGSLVYAASAALRAKAPSHIWNGWPLLVTRTGSREAFFDRCADKLRKAAQELNDSKKS